MQKTNSFLEVFSKLSKEGNLIFRNSSRLLSKKYFKFLQTIIKTNKRDRQTDDFLIWFFMYFIFVKNYVDELKKVLYGIFYKIFTNVFC